MSLSPVDLAERLLQALPLAPAKAVQSLALALHSAWSGPGRAYHNLRHLAECLAAFDAARGEARDPAAVSLALLFHDAIYQPARGDNEAQSAAWAVEALKALGATASLIAPVRQMILATQSHRPDGDPDTALLLDIDLSILAADPARFSDYEQAIRGEYAHIGDSDFARARAAVMRGFATRPRLFHSDHFHQRLESRARQNLSAWT